MKKVFSILLMLIPIILTAQQKYDSSANDIYRIMNYNIRNAKGMDGVTDYNRIATVINNEQPEVVAIQEVDSITTRNNKYVLGELANMTGMHATFSAAIPFQGGKYGIGILSKEEPLSVIRLQLPGSEEPRTLLIAEFENYILCCTHLSLTKKDAEESVDIINGAVARCNFENKGSKPILLAGDFNVQPDSPTISTFSKSWTILSDTNIFTFPSNKPDRTIDYIMGYTTNGIKIDYVVRKYEVMEEKMASDHRPLLIDISFEPANQ
jgi:endonuclease/exonuclease/phosphatase family metal-dependent hydrolase